MIEDLGAENVEKTHVVQGTEVRSNGGDGITAVADTATFVMDNRADMMEEPDAEESMKRDFRLIDEMNKDPGAEDLNVVDAGTVRTILNEDLDAEERGKSDDIDVVMSIAVNSREPEARATSDAKEYGITAATGSVTEVVEDYGGGSDEAHVFLKDDNALAMDAVGATGV